MQLLVEHCHPRRVNTALRVWRAALLSTALLLQACNLPLAQTSGSEPTAVLEPTVGPSEQAATEVPATPKPTRIPTPAATPTVWPPVLDLRSLEDIRNLDSFVVTVNEKNTVNGQLTERTITVGYIREPFSAYLVNEYHSGVDRTYVVNDRTYALTGSGDWYISAGASDDLFLEADIPAGNTEKLVGAEFVGEEEYQGIPAYHFELKPSDPMDANANDQVEGDFYLAIDGNYVLFSHWKETSRQGDFVQIYEVTEALSSIHQLTEIELPADMEGMVPAAELPFELKLPLPPGSAFRGMIRYRSGIGVDLYYLSTPKTGLDEFLDYYRGLPPTDGWTVSHVGHVRLHQDDCEFTRECVIIQRGSTQVILYYNGADIRAEFDWPHLYAPLD
jgi:hypothetical protein